MKLAYATRKIQACLALVVSLPALLLSQSTSTQAPARRSLVLTNVTVIDTTGGPSKPAMTVVIASDRIARLDVTARLSPPEDAHVIDASGKFLIPGLWDMHFHLDDPELWPVPVSREDKEAIFPLLIANGVTGIRDMAGSLEQLQQWKQKIALGQLLGPRIVAAGPFVDGPLARWPGSLSVSSDVDARGAVRALRRRGADFVKVYSGLPPSVFFALADEAKKLGMDFVGHVQDLVSAAAVSDAGQKSMEHLDGIMLACSTEEEKFRKRSPAATSSGKRLSSHSCAGIPACSPHTARRNAPRYLLDSSGTERGRSRRSITNGVTPTPSIRYSRRTRASAITRNHSESIGEASAFETRNSRNASRD
jgi:hypothetical protein